MPKDINLKLQKRKGKPVNKFIFGALNTFVLMPFLVPKMHCKVIRNISKKDMPKQFVIISNHTSRFDWLYVAKTLYPRCTNFMTSYVEFHRSHMHFIFDLLHQIPKKNFVSDPHMVREFLDIIKKGGNICFFPEGKSSLSGTNQPVIPGTGKLLKHAHVPVLQTRIRGGFMSSTQWNNVLTPGKVEIELNYLFTVEDLDKLSVEEIENRISEAIYNDDFKWNKERRIRYKGLDNVADKLGDNLFYCPKCHEQMTMKGKNREFKCINCGNGATINDYYDLTPLNDECVIPKDLTTWYHLERRDLVQRIRNNPDFEYRMHCKLGALPGNKYVSKKVTSNIVGEGELIINLKEFKFIGTRDSKPFEFSVPSINQYTLLQETESKVFGTHITGEYLEFYPDDESAMRVQMIVEEIHRFLGGKWQNNLKEQKWIYEDLNEEEYKELFI